MRLDDEARGALAKLEAAGLSRSDAIRKALLDAAAALQRHDALRFEVQTLEADEDDRKEMRAIAELMEDLRAPG